VGDWLYPRPLVDLQHLGKSPLELFTKIPNIFVVLTKLLFERFPADRNSSSFPHMTKPLCQPGVVATSKRKHPLAFTRRAKSLILFESSPPKMGAKLLVARRRQVRRSTIFICRMNDLRGLRLPPKS